MMSIKTQEMKTFREDLYCDKCGYIMVDTGKVYTTHPPQYEYICTQCRHSVSSIYFYPNIVYVPIED